MPHFWTNPDDVAEIRRTNDYPMSEDPKTGNTSMNHI